MTAHAPISPVYRLGQRDDDRDPLETWGRMERLRRNAWQKSGVIAVRPEELPGELGGRIKAWAEENYGQRTE